MPGQGVKPLIKNTQVDRKVLDLDGWTPKQGVQISVKYTTDCLPGLLRWTALEGPFDTLTHTHTHTV